MYWSFAPVWILLPIHASSQNDVLYANSHTARRHKDWLPNKMHFTLREVLWVYYQNIQQLFNTPWGRLCLWNLCVSRKQAHRHAGFHSIGPAANLPSILSVQKQLRSEGCRLFIIIISTYIQYLDYFLPAYLNTVFRSVLYICEVRTYCITSYGPSRRADNSS